MVVHVGVERVRKLAQVFPQRQSAVQIHHELITHALHSLVERMRGAPVRGGCRTVIVCVVHLNVSLREDARLQRCHPPRDGLVLAIEADVR
eukprot:1430776-Prymnesium_polylepis.2